IEITLAEAADRDQGEPGAGSPSPRRGGPAAHLPHSPGGPASSRPEKTRMTKMSPRPMADQGERMHQAASSSHQPSGVRPSRPRPQPPSRDPVFSTERSKGIVAYGMIADPSPMAVRRLLHCCEVPTPMTAMTKQMKTKPWMPPPMRTPTSVVWVTY